MAPELKSLAWAICAVFDACAIIVGMMKTVLIPLLVLSFVAVAGYGLFAMNHSAADHGGCATAAVQGLDCPAAGQTSIAHVASHLKTFRNFLSASGSVATLWLALLAVLAVVATAVFWLALLLSGGLRPRSPLYPLGALAVPWLAQPGLLRWLALHETSPTNS